MIMPIIWVMGSCIGTTSMMTPYIVGVASCDWIDSDREDKGVDTTFVTSAGRRFHKVMKVGEQFGPIFFSRTFGLAINVGGIAPALIEVAEFKYRQHEEKVLRVPMVPEADIRFLESVPGLRFRIDEENEPVRQQMNPRAKQ